MKPNFSELTNAELRSYVLQHRDDLDALEALFNRRRADVEPIVFHPPQSQQEEQQQFEQFKRLVNEKAENQDNSAA
jgi:hypothetical protein